MSPRRRTAVRVFICLAVAGAGLCGAALAAADPTDSGEPTPVTTSVVAPPPAPPVSNDPMTPRQPPVPADPAAVAPGTPAPAPAAPAAVASGPGDLPPVPRPSVPPVQNPNGANSGGILGSIIDLWHQARNPDLTPGAGLGAPAPPPGAGPAPPLPPGYVSTNSPGSETPSVNAGAGSPDGRPPLPPGYYPIGGPPPPWYLDPAASAPAS